MVLGNTTEIIFEKYGVIFSLVMAEEYQDRRNAGNIKKER